MLSFHSAQVQSRDLIPHFALLWGSYYICSRTHFQLIGVSVEKFILVSNFELNIDMRH